MGFVVFLVLIGVVGLGSSAQAAITISSHSGSVMYTDLGNGLNATYLIFQITSDAPVADAWVELDTGGGNIENVGSGVHRLKFKPGPDGGNPIAETGLVAGEPKGAFFLVRASAVSAIPQNLTVTVYDADPSGAANVIGGPTIFAFTVEDTIQANANKVTTVVTIPENPQIGQLGKITVTGCTGVVGEAKVLYFTPVSEDTWPADEFEFVDSDISIQNYPNNNYKNIALIPPADVLTTNNCYTEIFRFAINDQGEATTTPANYISSGQQVKHTTNDSGSFNVVIPPAECGTITVSSNPDPLPAGVGGSPYPGATFNATGGTGPYTFAAVGLPSGLTLSSGGVLSGTTTEVGVFNISVTATDTGADPQLLCQGVLNTQLTINCPTITVLPSTLPAGQVGSAYSVQFTASGGVGPFEFVISGGVLPDGITLSLDGLLSGTPTGSGNFPFTITATDTDNGTCESFRVFSTFSINSLPPTEEVSIPTASDWALLTLLVLLAGAALIRMRF
ncbi:MAG TPA: Ig domain-containing protein [Thermoanaerobaculia bacterium]|nr:Ig domain-containing protein [Thermoanaerobaculia bacterium]